MKKLRGGLLLKRHKFLQWRCLFKNFWPMGSTGSPLGRWDRPGEMLTETKGVNVDPDKVQRSSSLKVAKYFKRAVSQRECGVRETKGRGF